MSLRMDVTHERAATDLLDESPDAVAHGVLAVMKAVREATAQLSLIETRVKDVGDSITDAANATRLAPVGGEDDCWINPASVSMIRASPQDTVTVTFTNGQSMTIYNTTPVRIAEMLSW